MNIGCVAVNNSSAARHAQGATKGLGAIAGSFFLRLKWQYFPLLLSDYGRDIVLRKYDALSTDRAYENHPSGLLGPVGTWLDKKVLEFPLHEALRQRLRIVADDLKSEINERHKDGSPEIRVLSAPCGLIRDLLTCASELRAENRQLFQKAEWHALDLDASGEVLAAAAQRSADAGLPVHFYQDDLFKPQNLTGVLATGVKFDIVNCIGLTAWLDLREVEHLERFFHDRVLREGGSLVVDNWAWHQHSALGKDLEINTRYHDAKAFVETLKRAGFEIAQENTTANGVCTVYIARAVSK